MSGRLRVGLIGYGYWGPNLARNFSYNPDCKLVRITDLDANRRQLAQENYPACEVVPDAQLITRAKDIDIVAVATPVFTHLKLTKDALEHGKHVLVEKPIASSVNEAMEIYELSERKKLIVVVDHTFLFTDAVIKIKELINNNELGDLYYYDSTRINLGLFQHDVNVIWDLAVHDLAIMDFLLGPCARAVSAVGSEHFGRTFVDVAYLTVYYDNNLIAHFHVNWLSPVKIRKTIVGASKKMLVWNHLEPEETIKVYDRGVEIKTKDGVYNALPEYRTGAMYSPVIKRTEALETEISYFLNCIKTSTRPHNDALAGMRVVRILEAANKSLEGRGVPIAID